MKQRIIIGIVCVALAAYILLAGRFYAGSRNDLMASALEICISDTSDHPFVKAEELRRWLIQAQIPLEARPASEVDLAQIERVVCSHPLIKSAECSLRPDGRLQVVAAQRIPIMRVLSEGQSCHFLDEDGQWMRLNLSASQSMAVDVPVATGQIAFGDSLLVSHLYDMAKRLKNNSFWNNMIEQIHVDAQGRWILTPRVGDFSIILGKPDRMDDKLAALHSFYDEVLPKVGWDRYSCLNLEYNNQLICTKK